MQRAPSYGGGGAPPLEGADPPPSVSRSQVVFLPGFGCLYIDVLYERGTLVLTLAPEGGVDAVTDPLSRYTMSVLSLNHQRMLFFLTSRYPLFYFSILFYCALSSCFIMVLLGGGGHVSTRQMFQTCRERHVAPHEGHKSLSPVVTGD